MFNPGIITYDTAVDNNYLYVADTGNDQIDIFDKSIGGAPIAVINASNHPGLDFQSPMGVALDGQGHLFVSDSINMTNYEFGTASGNPLLTTFQGIVGAPFGMWANSAGTTVLVTEGENQRSIKVYQKQGNTFVQVNSLVPTASPNFVPIGIAGDGHGYVYVVDNENIVWKYQCSDFTIPPVQINLTGIGNAKYIAIDKFGDFYVTDNLGGYVVYNPDWSIKSTCASADGTPFSNPTGIAVDNMGSIYVCGYIQPRVVKMKSCLDLVFPTLTPTFTFTPTPTLNCCQSDLVWNGVTASQELRVTADKVIVAVAGNGTGNAQVAIYDKTLVDGSSPSAVIKNSDHPGLDFVSPSGVAMDGLGHLFVCDFGNQKIYRFDDINGTSWTTIDGSTGLPGTTGTLGDLRSIWANGAGTTLIVTEFSSQSVRVFARINGVYNTVQKFTQTQYPIQYPIGLASDSGGDVYMVDMGTRKVWKFLSDFSGMVQAADLTGTINLPRYLSCDNLSHFYVTDNNNQYVVYDNNWQPIASCGGPTGTTPPNFYQPQGIGADLDGKVYVSDQSNNRIVRMQACAPMTFPPTPTPACWQVAGVPWVNQNSVGGIRGLALDPYLDWLAVAKAGGLNIYQAYDGQFVKSILDSRLNNAYVVAADSSPNMYVGCRDGSSGSIYRVDLVHNSVNLLTSQIGQVRGICVDPTGKVYVTTEDDGNGNMIYVVDTGGTVTPLNPGNINGLPLGYPDDILKIGNDGGTLYITDSSHLRIVSLDLSNYNTYISGSGAVVPYGSHGPANPSQIALQGNSQTGNIYVGSFDGGFWLYKNQNPTPPFWSLLSPKNFTDSSIVSLGNVFGLAVDHTGAVYFINQNETLFKVYPCTTSQGQPMALRQGNSKGNATPTSTPTVTPTPTPTPLRITSPVAAPNVSRGGEPVKFMVPLDKAAEIRLSLFTLTGEGIYQDSMQGTLGLNTMVWTLKNQSESPVASGLYLYLLRVDDGSRVTTYHGKVAVLH
ncbi:MAG TPA: NHL repeat-containing protein [bacterium]|nr:NHL repeat-containing protein [bacterium]